MCHKQLVCFGTWYQIVHSISIVSDVSGVCLVAEDLSLNATYYTIEILNMMIQSSGLSCGEASLRARCLLPASNASSSKYCTFHATKLHHTNQIVHICNVLAVGRYLRLVLLPPIGLRTANTQINACTRISFWPWFSSGQSDTFMNGHRPAGL